MSSEVTDPQLTPAVPPPSAPAAPVSGTSERKQARRENIRLVLRRPGFIIGALITLFWIVCAIGGDRITPHDPLNFRTTTNLRPSTSYWFGTDQTGRDVLSRVMAGARDVLVVAPPAALIGVLLGTILGLITGFIGGWLDSVVGRIVEAFLALPVTLIALLALTTLGKSRLVVITVVAVLFTPVVSRTVRASVLAERQLDYVTSARLRGESKTFIMFKEILPNITAPITVELTVRIGYAVFTVATLSFLGVGPPKPSPDWGAQVAENYGVLSAGIWWSTIFPALAIATLVVAVNLMADAVQAVWEG